MEQEKRETYANTANSDMNPYNSFFSAVEISGTSWSNVCERREHERNMMSQLIIAAGWCIWRPTVYDSWLKNKSNASN